MGFDHQLIHLNKIKIMEVNVKVTVDLGDKTMSLFSGFMSANQAVAKAADTAGKVLKKYADEPAENKEDVRPEPVRGREDAPTNDAEAYTEDELKDMSPKELTAILKREFNVDPDKFDGKNTNKKLRDLILDAQEGKLETAEDPEPDENEDARPERGAKPGRNTDVTHDDVRDLMAEVIEADEDNRPKVLKQLNKIGAKSVGTIKDEDLADFFGFLQSLKDA